MKTLIAILALTTSTIAFSADCNYQTSQENFKLKWTAFKTPSKAGVSGSFKDLGIAKKKLIAPSVEGVLSGLAFSISTPTVDTKLAQRDMKISKFFFNGIKDIKGKVIEADKSSLTVEINMNGVKKEVPMDAELKNNTYTATGVIDVFDFGMSKNLAALNKACFELHQGKTWNDVTLQLSVDMKQVCK